MHVLLVDRDPVLRRAAAQMLPRFRVDAFALGPEAFRAFEETEYEALVVDQRGGSSLGRDGLDLARAFRERRRDSGIVATTDGATTELHAQPPGLVDVVLRRADIEGRVLRLAVEEAVAARSGMPPSCASSDSLSTELRSLLDDARDALAAGRLIRAEQAYQLSLVARAASSDPTRGRRRANECARSLGLTRHRLLAYALLASRFSHEEFRELLAVRRNVHGEYITVSHLQLLAALPRSSRQVWVERTFSEGLTVRQLRSIVKRQGGRLDGANR